jgi:hypothetical protein
MEAGKFELSYNIELIRTDHWTGELIDRSEIHNIIVNTGLERIAKLLNGESVVPFTHIAIGTDDTVASATDTALVAQVASAEATASYEADYKAKWSHLFTFGSGESYTIEEIGIFAGTTMLNRAIATEGKVVDSDTDLTVNVTVTVGRAV